MAGPAGPRSAQHQRPSFLLLFASTYVVMAAISASNFSAPMTHTNGLYFTVTVFATVGFGDITAKTEAARLVVTVQMMIDLVILGLGLGLGLGPGSFWARSRAAENGGQARDKPDAAHPKGKSGRWLKGFNRQEAQESRRAAIRRWPAECTCPPLQHQA
jgi:hypothetical protein